MVSMGSNACCMALPFQYNTLLSNMETKYSVAQVCRDNGACHPLDPGEITKHMSILMQYEDFDSKYLITMNNERNVTYKQEQI